MLEKWKRKDNFCRYELWGMFHWLKKSYDSIFNLLKTFKTSLTYNNEKFRNNKTNWRMFPNLATTSKIRSVRRKLNEKRSEKAIKGKSSPIFNASSTLRSRNLFSIAFHFLLLFHFFFFAVSRVDNMKFFHME